MSDSIFASHGPNEPSSWHKRFEDKRVRIVLEEFKLLSHLHDLLNDCWSRHSERRLTFESFNDRFPAFPILLAARVRGRVAEHCSPAELFRKFDDVFLMRYYLDAYSRFEDQAQGRPVGLVAPFDGYRNAFVVHNGDYETRGTWMGHDVPDDRPPHRVTVEPFRALVRHLARGDWTPESPLPEKSPKQQARLSREMTFTPWIVEKVTSLPALVLLAWLRKVLLSSSGYDRHLVTRGGEGERCVAATHEQIAEETRLSTDQVKRGLAALRDAGLVFQPRRGEFLLSADALAGEGDAAE